MSDLAAKIAQLEALRSTLGDAAVDAALAALRAEAAEPATRQRIATGEAGTIVNPMQISAGGDVQGNLVLREITIAAGGTLIVGAPPADPPL